MVTLLVTLDLANGQQVDKPVTLQGPALALAYADVSPRIIGQMPCQPGRDGTLWSDNFSEWADLLTNGSKSRMGRNRSVDQSNV